MVPSDEDSAPPPRAGDHDVVMSMTLEPPPAAGAASVEEVKDMVACHYMDFPGIGTIDLDALSFLTTTGSCWKRQRSKCSPNRRS
jgi:hypothetical protein